MSILGYRRKRNFAFAVSLLVLLFVSSTVFIKGITPPSPTGTWAAAGNGLNLSSPKSGAAAVQFQDGRILITGGDNGSGALATADIYDTQGNFSAAASMNVARSQHTATLLQDGTVLVAGGVGSSGSAISGAEIYNPSNNTWTVTSGALNTARSDQTATALPDGTVLIAGGDNGGSPLSSLEIYNPTNEMFSTVEGSLSSPREQHAAAALQTGDVLLVGGFNGTAALATTDIYSFSKNTVGPGPTMSTPRQGLTATTQLDGNVLIAGGNNGSANGNQDLASAEVYSASAGTFTLTGNLTTARQGHLAFLLPHNGAILIVGGTTTASGAETATSSAELYYALASGTDANPNWNGTFNATGTMASPRVGATGSPLSNGTPSSLNDGILLVAGGKDASSSTLSSGELYGFAWVKTDATDYAPGTTVNITGGGWQPGETVTLHFQESPYFDSHPVLTAVADSNGDISNSQFAPDLHDIDIRFYLTATGGSSGSLAQTTFTDGNNDTVTLDISGASGTVSNNQNSNTCTLNGTRQSGSGCSITVAQPDAILFTASSGATWSTIPQYTLTGCTTGSTTCTLTTGGNKNGTLNVTILESTTTTITNASSLATATVVGQSYAVNYSVTSTGGGVPGTDTVTVSDGTSTCTGTVSAGTCNLTSTTVGSPKTITATYNGDTNFNFASSTSTGVSHTVNQAATTTTILNSASLSATPSVVGQGYFVSYSVAVTSPGGGTILGTDTVTVSDGTSNCTASVTAGVCTLTSTSEGPKTITAKYNGDTNFASSTSAGVSHTVNQASTSTSVSSSLNPSNFGQTVTFSATVGAVSPGSGTPTGSVIFKDGPNQIGVGILNGSGVATFSTAALLVGSHSITATYNGDVNYIGSTSSSLTQTVNKASNTTTISVSPSSITVGQSTTVTAAVTPRFVVSATGTVSVSDGLGGTGDTCTITLANATGTCNLMPSANGNPLTVTGTYNGDSNYATSQGGTSLTVTGTPPQFTSGATTTFTAGVFGTFTVTASGTPTPTLSENAGDTVPTGVTFNAATGVLSGTPTQSGTFALHFTASNGVGTNATQTFTLTVNPGALASITLSPPVATITAGASQAYSATGYDKYNNLIGDVTGATTFTVSKGTCTGNVCSSTVAGGQTVTGKDGGIAGTATLNVMPGAITSLTLSPTTATITAGGSQAYTAQGMDMYGNPAGDVTSSTTFTISGSGSCTGASCTSNAAGTYTVTGTYSGTGAQGTATLNVTAGSFTQLQILAPGETAAPGTTTGFTGSPNVQYVNGAFNLTVNAVDANFNVVSSVTDPVHITTNDPHATLPTTDAALVAGTGTFAVTPEAVSYNPATTTFTATDTTDNSIPPATTNPAIEVITAYTAGITPTMVGREQGTTYTLTISNAAAPNTNNLESATVAVPTADQGTITSVSVTATTQPGNAAVNWSYDASQLPGTMRFAANSSSDAVAPGGTITITFTATSSAAVNSSPVQEVWNTVAFSDSKWTSPLPLAPPKPTVSVGVGPSFTSAASTTFTYGSSGSFTVTTNGVPTNKLTESGTLPPGVTFTDNGDDTATIAGTPTAAGIYPITITAHNGFGSDATQNFSLTVNKAATTTSLSAPTVTYPSNGVVTVTVSSAAGTPTGNATLSVDGGSPLSAPLNSSGVATFTLTSPGAGTHSLSANYATQGNFAASGPTPGMLTVSPAALTITAKNATKTYGQAVTFAGTEFSTSGLVNGDTVTSVTLTSAGAAATAAVSGSPYPIIPGAAVGSGLSNYTITYANGTLTVNQATVTLQVTGASGIYNALPFPATCSVASGLVNGDSVTLRITYSSGTAPVNVGSYMATCTSSGNPNYQTATGTAPIVITPAPLTISADNQSMTFGGTAPGFTASYSGFQGSDNPAVVGGLAFTVYTDNTLSIAVTDFQTLKAGSYPIVASGGSAANYTIMYVNGTLTVNKATFTGSVTISPVDPTTVPYGQPVTATVLLNSYNIGGVPVLQPHADPNNPNQQLPESLTVYLVPAGGGPSKAMKFGTATAVPAYDNTANTTGTTKTGWTAMITGKAPTPGNYTAFVYGDDPGDGSLTNLNLADSGYFYTDTADIIYPTLQSKQLDVVPAALTITANDESKTYGQTVTFSGTEFTTSGLVNSDTVTSVTLTSAGAAATATVAGSPYPIVPSAAVGSGLSNYTITYVNGALTVKQAMVTPSITASNKAFDGTTTATVTCSLTGVVNSDSVTCSPAASANFSQANAGNGLTVTATGITLGGSAAANYSLASTTATTTANINPAPTSTTVISNPDPSVYGQTVTFTAFVNNTGSAAVPTGNVSFTIDGGAPVAGTPEVCPSAIPANRMCAKFSTSAITVTGSPHSVFATYTNSDGNFASGVGVLTGGQTVTPAPLMITASSGAMIYGGPVPPITASYSGFVNGDIASSLTTQPACGTTATSSSPVGTYASSCSGAVDPNYMFSYVPGTVTVNQATTTTTVTSSTNGASIFLQPVMFTATVTPQFTGGPGGTVTFYDAGSNTSPTCASPGTQIGTPQPLNLVPAAASVSTATLSGTSHTILACYSGDTNFLASPGTVNQTVTPAPVVTVAPGSISFTGQNVGTTSSPMSVTLTNIGDASLTISGVNIINSTVAGEFAIKTNNCGGTLGYPGESGSPATSCTVAVTFTPKDTGEASATLQISDNNDDNNSSQQNVILTGGGLSTISAGGSLYEDAVFATGNSCGSLTLSGGSTIDSFNSLGSFSNTHQLGGANVGSNGNVTLGGKSAIYGSASVLSTTTGNCGKTSVTGLTTNGGSQVTGGLNQLGGAVSYPAPPVPNPAPPTTSVNVSHSCPSGMTGCTNAGSNTVTLAPGSYGNIQFSGGTTVYLNTGTYNFNSLTLTGNSVMRVGSGPVIINIGGAGLSGNSPALDLSGGSIVNPTGIPSNLQFYYGGSRGVNLSGGSQAYATVYAPSAPVNMSGGTDFFGGIIGLSITDSGGTALHYDSNLTNVAQGDTLWLTAVINNLNVGGVPVSSRAGQIKLYLTNSTVSFAAANAGQCTGAGETYNSGTSTCTVAVPNAVVTLNSSSATSPKTSYDLTNNRWVTSVPPSDLTGNTFVAGVAIPVPAGLPTGLQNVSWSTAFSTDTPNLTFQWQWSAGVYNSFGTTYAQSGNTNMLGVTPEDGSADVNGTDPAGAPETYKKNEVIGFFSSASGVAAAAAEMSAAPSNYAFGTQTKGTPSGTVMVSTLTNNDGVTHNLSSIAVQGTNAADFVLQSGGTNSCVGMTSLAGLGGSCNLYIIFNPTTTGAESARIVINDDANNSPQTVYLTGTGQ